MYNISEIKYAILLICFVCYYCIFPILIEYDTMNQFSRFPHFSYATRSIKKQKLIKKKNNDSNDDITALNEMIYINNPNAIYNKYYCQDCKTAMKRTKCAEIIESYGIVNCKLCGLSIAVNDNLFMCEKDANYLCVGCTINQYDNTHKFGFFYLYFMFFCYLL